MNWRSTTRLPPIDCNQTTRRFARTIPEAFGAYADRSIESETVGWRVSDVACPAGLVLMLALLAAGAFG